jgi:hypothetical protein
MTVMVGKSLQQNKPIKYDDNHNSPPVKPHSDAICQIGTVYIHYSGNFLTNKNYLKKAVYAAGLLR